MRVVNSRPPLRGPACFASVYQYCISWSRVIRLSINAFRIQIKQHVPQAIPSRWSLPNERFPICITSCHANSSKCMYVQRHRTSVYVEFTQSTIRLGLSAWQCIVDDWWRTFFILRWYETARSDSISLTFDTRTNKRKCLLLLSKSDSY